MKIMAIVMFSKDTIAQLVLYDLPHVLIIQRYVPSWYTVEHQPHIRSITIAQCHDTDISTNQMDWPPHVSGDISALSDVELEFQFSVFRGMTFRSWLSQANYIFYTFCINILHGQIKYINCLNHQWYIPPLGWEALHCWLWIGDNIYL